MLYLLVLLSFTPHFFCISMQFDQSEISSRIICKAAYMYMYDSVSIHCNTLVMDDGEENA